MRGVTPDGPTGHLQRGTLGRLAGTYVCYLPLFRLTDSLIHVRVQRDSDLTLHSKIKLVAC